MTQLRGPRLSDLSNDIRYGTRPPLESKRRRVGLMADPETQFLLDEFAKQGIGTSDVLRLALRRLDAIIRPDASPASVRQMALSYGVSYNASASELDPATAKRVEK